MKRLQIFLKYLKNNRIDDYEKIIASAIKQGYQLISMEMYVNHKFDNSKKILILRHDIDEISLGTKLMFEQEKKYQAYASYYFRKTTADFNLIKEIKSWGSECSLHFETIAEFARVRSITTVEQLVKENFKEKCKGILKNELEQFRLLYDVEAMTIASHGEPENRMLGIPNNTLTEELAMYEILNIKLEAYNEEFIKILDSYISDQIVEINDGYRYGIHPMEHINQGSSPILFLTHPCHWHYSPKQQLKRLIKSIIKKPIYTQEHFKRI